MKDYAKFCSELEEFEACNLEVCPEPTASPNVIDSKYNTMDCQCTVAVQNLKISSQFVGVYLITFCHLEAQLMKNKRHFHTLRKIANSNMQN